VNSNLENFEKKWSLPNLRYCSVFLAERLRKIMKSLIEDDLSPGPE
jgi:hypothetical protein